jgi:recombination protein RecA
MSNLDSVIKDLNKKFKTNLINEGLVFEKISRIPFSSPRLNYMMYGGLPVGRIVEFAGEEGGGKTTTALDVVANAQRLFPEKKVAYVDVERTLDPEWAQKLGVDVEKLILVSPEEQTAEQRFEITKAIVETGEISVCVLDSLAAMVSSQAYSKTIEEQPYAVSQWPLTLFSHQEMTTYNLC